MHNAFLGTVALIASIYCFFTKKAVAGIGFLLLAVVLDFSFLVTITGLPVDIIGPVLVILFAVGCLLIVYELGRKQDAKEVRTMVRLSGSLAERRDDERHRQIDDRAPVGRDERERHGQERDAGGNQIEPPADSDVTLFKFLVN